MSKPHRPPKPQLEQHAQNDRLARFVEARKPRQRLERLPRHFLYVIREHEVDFGIPETTSFPLIDAPANPDRPEPERVLVDELTPPLERCELATEFRAHLRNGPGRDPTPLIARFFLCPIPFPFPG